MDNKADWIIVGRFGRPHGIKGLISVISFTEPRDNILSYVPWYVSVGHEWQLVKLVRVEMNNKSILAQIEGYHQPEQVAALTNIEIAVQAEKLPALGPDEYYWHQLIDMQVVDTQGNILGVVKDIMPTGSNDVLVVEGSKRRLIPYIQGQYILNINAEKCLITADWDADF